MKKVLSLALAFILAFALAIPAFAATLEEEGIAPKGDGDNFLGTNNGNEQTVVTYNVAGSYTISIPASITINYSKDNIVDTGSDNTIQATEVMLPHAKQLKVTVSGIGQNGAFELYANGDKNVDVVTFKITADTKNINPGDLSTPVLQMQKEGVRDTRGLWGYGPINLVLTANELPKYNETYTGYLTFTAQVVDAEPTPSQGT